MNASEPPTTATNPKPFSALNHLTMASTGSAACEGAFSDSLIDFRMPIVGILFVVKTAAPRLTVVVFVAAHSSPVRNNPADLSRFSRKLRQEGEVQRRLSWRRDCVDAAGWANVEARLKIEVGRRHVHAPRDFLEKQPHILPI